MNQRVCGYGIREMRSTVLLIHVLFKNQIEPSLQMSQNDQKIPHSIVSCVRFQKQPRDFQAIKPAMENSFEVSRNDFRNYQNNM